MKGYYEALESGHIYSHKTKRVLQPSSNGAGYQHIILYLDKKPIDTYVHRFLAEELIPNPLNYNEVNHIDGDKTNNQISNLEWITSSGNKIHALETGLRKYKKIVQMSLSGDIIAKYENRNQASSITGLSPRNISRAAAGNQKTAGGFKWVYA